MKAARHFLFVLVIGLAGLSPVALQGQTNVSFPDPNLESAILSALHRTNGPLTTADLATLTNLTCWSGITDLTGLESAENLESLSLYYGRPGSLLPLAGLAHLKRLDLELGWPLDSTNLAKLTNLTRLDLYAARLTDTGWLTALTNLTYLDLGWNSISNPASLAALPSLTYLDLSGNPLENGGALAALTNVAGSLLLGNISLTNIACLAGLNNLKELTLYGNQVTDLTPVSALTNLTLLDVGCNRIQNFACLGGLTNLQALYLQANSISNLISLPLLPNLVDLEVSYNRLGNLEALFGMTNLNWLDADNNLLTNIATLTNLSHLDAAFLMVNLLQTNAGSADMDVIQSLQGKGTHVYYGLQNSAPGISISTNWFVPANENSYIPIYISDDFTSGDRLQVAVQSSSTNVLSANFGKPPPSSFLYSAAAYTSSWLLAMPRGIAAPRMVSIPAFSSYLKVTPVPNQAGTATVTITVTGETGFASSVDVQVTVSSPVPFDGQSFGNSASNLTWRTFGQSLWAAQNNEVHSGSTAAQSGSLESWLEATLTGPGTLTFWTKSGSTNAHPGSGILRASCSTTGLSGSIWMSSFDWEKQTLSFPAGTWTVRWQNNGSYGSETLPLWLADVSFVPGPPVCWLERLVPGGPLVGMGLHGPPGGLYDVESSSDLCQWSKAGRAYMNSFDSWFIDTNAAPGARFYRMREVVLPPLQLRISHFETDQVAHLAVHGEPGQPFLLEYSTNLVTWESLLQTNNVSGDLQVFDPAATSPACRFYRAKALPWLTGLLPTPGPPYPTRRPLPPGVSIPGQSSEPVPLPSPPVPPTELTPQ